MPSIGSGTTCAVRGCHYNRKKLNVWLKQECYDHKPLTKSDCSCPQWYHFYRLPTDEEDRRIWLRNLYLKRPPKALYVCSFHFVDKKPTEKNPYPTLWLGHRIPPEKKRRVIKKETTDVGIKDEPEDIAIDTFTQTDAETPDGSSTEIPQNSALQVQHQWSRVCF